MAKARVSTNPMYTGGAGGYSFYVRQSEQIVRQRKNNSNYGESARRSRAQMERRVRWANLVNLYKACQSWMPKAFESKKENQTDYNAFMSVNVDRSVVALTKSQAQTGSAVWESIQLSRGALPSVQLSYDGASFLYVSDISITNAITSSTTVGQLASDIISNNPQFIAGDNIAVIELDNDVDVRAMTAAAWTRYAEVTLNVADSTLLTEVPGLGDILRRSTSGYLSLSFPGGYAAGGVLIHTRKQSGRLMVSSQNAILSGDEVVRRFSTSEWVEQAILSYGLDTDVLLAPGDDVSGGGEAVIIATGSVEGDSSSVVLTDPLSVSYARLRVRLNPSSWPTSGFSDLGQYAFAFQSAPSSTFSSDEVVTYYHLAINEMQQGGAVPPLSVELPATHRYVRMVFRANTGSIVDYTIEAIV